MRRHRTAITIVSGALGVASVGVGASAATAYGTPTKSPAPQMASVQRPARAASPTRPATVRTAKATVDGKPRPYWPIAEAFPFTIIGSTGPRSLLSLGS